MARHRVYVRAITVVAVVALAGLAAVMPAAAKPQGTPLKVMMIYEKSAGLAASPNLSEGALAAAKALNKQNGVGGHTIKVLACDTADDPNTAADCGRTAVQQGVVALVGNFTLHGDAFLPLMLENKIPSIGVTAASATDFTSPDAFPIVGGAPEGFGNLPRFLADAGAKSIALVRPDIAAGGITKQFANAALAKVGKTLTNDVPVPNDAPDMSSYVQAALAGGTDGIMVGLAGQQALNFVQAAKQADPNVKLGLLSTEPAKVRAALGSEAAGIIQSASVLEPSVVKTKAGTQFLNDMKAAGFGTTDANAINAWLSVQVLAKVAKGLPKVTAAAIFDKLNTTTGLKTGLTPPLQWTTPADVGLPLPRVFNVCGLAVKLTKTKKVTPVTGKFFDSYADKECPTP